MNKLTIPEQRKKGRWFCGPYAIAAITGKSFEQIRAAINYTKGAPSTQGVGSVQTWQLKDALMTFGYLATTVYHHKTNDGSKRTLGQWMKKCNRNYTYIAYVTSHYVTVQGGFMIDTFTRHKVGTDYGPHQRKTVKEIYRIHQI